MLYQLNAIEETFLLYYLTSFILGIQVVIYIFYRYIKIRDKRLPLNKILISIGLFYLLHIMNVFISAIDRFFIEDDILNDILHGIGNALMLFSFIGFLIFIIVEDLSNIVNLKLSRIIMIGFSLLSIIAIILPAELLFKSILTIGLIIFGAVYTLLIQYRIINLSKGIIKKRLLNIMIGYIALIISIFFLADIHFIFNRSDDLYTIIIPGLSLLIMSLFFTVLGVYAFPVFYEFKWEENILNLFIINQKNRFCLYCRDFSELGIIEPQQDYKTLFSVGIIGIDNILALITNTKGEKVDKIKQADSLILLEYGSKIAPQIIYALIVRRDLKSNIYFLKMVKKQFESFYKEILSELDSLKGNEEQLFMSFDIILKDMLYER